LVEGEMYQEADGVTAVAFAPVRFVADRDEQLAIPALPVEASQAAFANRNAVEGLDDEGAFAIKPARIFDAAFEVRAGRRIEGTQKIGYFLVGEPAQQQVNVATLLGSQTHQFAAHARSLTESHAAAKWRPASSEIPG